MTPGFLDDQSLSPKIGRADYVAGAVCHHSNPERLSEVFASGVWAGKSIYHLHGARALWRYFPGLAVFDALGAAGRARMAALFPYAMVYEPECSGDCSNERPAWTSRWAVDLASDRDHAKAAGILVLIVDNLLRPRIARLQGLPELRNVA